MFLVPLPCKLGKRRPDIETLLYECYSNSVLTNVFNKCEYQPSGNRNGSGCPLRGLAVKNQITESLGPADKMNKSSSVSGRSLLSSAYSG